VPGTRPPYPPEFKRQIMELARTEPSGRGLVRDSSHANETIPDRMWQADRDEDADRSGLTTGRRKELHRLCRKTLGSG